MRIRAEDAELRSTLKQDEQLVRQSTDRMQQDFNELRVSVGSTGDASMVASSGVMALGQAATASGSAALQATANIANLGIGLRVLGNQALGARAQLAATGASIGRWLISPAGLAVAAILAIGTAVAVTFSDTARRKLTMFGLGFKELEESNRALEERLKAQNRDFKKRVQLLEDQVILETTGVRRALERMRPRERELTLQLESVKAAKAQEAAAAQIKLALDSRILALTNETLVIKGLRTVYDDIKNIEERRLTIARDKAAADRDSASAARAERSAKDAMLRSHGPQTLGEAHQRIQQATDIYGAQQRGIMLLLQALKFQREHGIIDDPMYRLLLDRLNVFPRSSDPAAGPFRSGGVEAGAFRGGRIAFGAVALQTGQDKQTKVMEQVRDKIQSLRDDIKAGGLGGGAGP
jgi:hypothetical protein